MRLRTVIVILSAALVWLCSAIVAPAAFALTQIKLSDLAYKECPPEYAEGMVTSWGSKGGATCYLITGKAKNPSGKVVYDADVFGQIYDANDEPVMQNRSRVGFIEEVPPGLSEFELRITVASNQPTPLKLDKFKASGFDGRVRSVF